jgi:hypothetical protein
LACKYRLSEHRETAALVRRLFPDVATIADVGGGDGTLAKLLRRMGYMVTTIDPAPRDTAFRAARRCLCRAAPTADACGYWPENFVASMAMEFDLVVGLRPCEATRETVLAAQHARVLIVPCCDKWGTRARFPPVYRSRKHKASEVPDVKPTIRRVWKRLGIQWEEATMKNKDLVAMWTNGTHSSVRCPST